ncbi:unnamed protein product [Lupinus luteus]|uniref:Transmembrane protein n=1 Tax=Lupinus luteus TaxID=3873 RepID=A0AAV1W9Y5_LUPLU
MRLIFFSQANHLSKTVAYQSSWYWREIVLSSKPHVYSLKKNFPIFYLQSGRNKEFIKYSLLNEKLLALWLTIRSFSRLLSYVVFQWRLSVSTLGFGSMPSVGMILLHIQIEFLLLLFASTTAMLKKENQNGILSEKQQIGSSRKKINQQNNIFFPYLIFSRLCENVSDVLCNILDKINILINCIPPEETQNPIGKAQYVQKLSS